ncbi:hypothetical protein PTQ55_16205 [Klebsiella pasteurii]|uniref:hypothetical protein n=1 Tax=Klebsiella pasteurii TaxID=2587529 RepID=UPI00287C7C50|nr:hypothetical protein [Klebsiella pasteurii]MDS7912977.1 hypothetical protein [Klebsiella pasteurii]
MTSKLTSDELLVKILSETQATIMEHNSRCVRGSVEVDARLFESMIMELQERRNSEMDSEPVAWIVHARTGDQLTTDGGYVANAEGILGLHSTPLYRHAQPAPNNRAITQHFDTIALETAREILCDVNRRHEFLGGDVQLLSRIQCRIDAACRAAMLQAGNSPQSMKCKTADELLACVPRNTGRSREHFISLCNEFWNWSEMDLVCADEKGYEPTMEWNGTKFTHRVTQALWRMYQAAPGNSPVIPDGYVMVPMRLTAENGAKGALSGEFSETKFINCPECFGDDECETCDGSGRIEITVPVTWTTIKEIWAKGVEHFAAAPQEVK